MRGRLCNAMLVPHQQNFFSIQIYTQYNTYKYIYINKKCAIIEAHQGEDEDDYFYIKVCWPAHISIVLFAINYFIYLSNYVTENGKSS